jgi:hypothetical protein
MVNANTNPLTGKQQVIMREVTALARHAGFSVLDLTQSYAGVERLETLWAAPWDDHPGTEGHRLLADQMYRQLIPHLRQPDPRAASDGLQSGRD